MKSREREAAVPWAERTARAVECPPDPASLSGFTCPECGGRIWEMDDEGLLRFQCRVGHSYSANSFLSTHTEALEGALWAALNALEENAALTRSMAGRARNRSHHLTARRLEEKAGDTESQAGLLRAMLERSRVTDQVTWEGGEEETRDASDDAPRHVNVVGDAAG